jgi:hypothetical protein
MKRVEKQRDEAEEERMKGLIRKMNEECELALRKQWSYAEELRQKTIEELREALRKEIFEEFKLEMERAIREAVQRAEVRWCFCFVFILRRLSFFILFKRNNLK